MANPKEQKPKVPKEPKEGKEPKEAKPKERAKKAEKGALEATAETIGSTLGTVAAAVGVGPSASPEKKNTPPRPKIGKLQKKNKQRMPRKLKKRLLKERAAKS